MMTESDFPTVEEIAEQLASQTSWWSPESDDKQDQYLDVRLQVESDGSWSIHTGSAQYDTSHLGFWGASSVPAEAKNDTADLRTFREIAEELRSEAMEDAWQAGEMEDDA